MYLLILLAINILCIIACHVIARSRGARPVFWGLMGAIFGPLAIPFAYQAKPQAAS